MITLKKLRWGNFRSYGKDNSLNLDSRTLTQLLGDNGAGKTTIPLMLQEVLYGKNIRGIKKEGLANRYTEEPGYWINLSFTKDAVNYLIDLKRNKTKVTVKLSENGLDISSHTATATYKTIASIIGIPDFKTFCQLTYQSTTDALDFLTATDTTRKRFLISLLDLSQYLAHHDVLKGHLKEVNRAKSVVEGNIETNMSWLGKYSNHNLDQMVKEEVPEMPVSLMEEIQKCKEERSNISLINKQIVGNNKYRKDVEKLGDVSELTLLPIDTEELKNYEADLYSLQREKAHLEKSLRVLRGVNTDPTCGACGQSIPFEDVSEQRTQWKSAIFDCDAAMTAVSPKISHIKTCIRENEKTSKTLEHYEYYMSKIDLGLSKVTLDEGELIKTGFRLSKQRVDIQAKIDKALKYNTEATAHNAKIQVIQEQIQDFKKDLVQKQKELTKLEEKAAYLIILRDVFSTNGLVSYKVEASVKVLEITINSYLAEFSEFRIRFKLIGEKLNVEVFDDFRNIIEIQTVSTGELGRINICTGLAIRKLLSTLTSTRLNFLFLDEVVSVLDPAGKEKLFEILQKEDLNTIIVAHEDTHPLIPKLEVEKVGNLSRLTDEDN